MYEGTVGDCETLDCVRVCMYVWVGECVCEKERWENTHTHIELKQGKKAAL